MAAKTKQQKLVRRMIRRERWRYNYANKPLKDLVQCYDLFGKNMTLNAIVGGNWYTCRYPGDPMLIRTKKESDVVGSRKFYTKEVV